MDKTTLISMVAALPRWAGIAFAVKAARIVQPNFNSWMPEKIYVTTVEEALQFTERLTVIGGNIAKAPLNMPQQIAMIVSAVSSAARSTWEDDLDPDSKPSGYATSAYAAAEAAEAAIGALSAVEFTNTLSSRTSVTGSLESAFKSYVHGATAQWFGSFEALKRAEAEAEQRFTEALSNELERFQRAATNLKWDDYTGIPWELFCKENPLMENPSIKTATRKLKIFLCHSSKDKQAVRKLHNSLVADGFAPWLDEKDILPGQDWELEIPKAVRSSDIVIVCISSNSINKAGYIQKEIRYALDVADMQPEGTVFLIPLKLDECTVPERLCRWQWVNFFENDGYNQLLRALRYRSSLL